jgi:small subunit ribosomal protein S1
VHISELSDQHVESPEQVVSVGQQVRVKVVDVDVPRRRISLSIRRVTDLEAGLVPEGEIEREIAPESTDEAVPAAAAAVADDDVVPETPAAEVAEQAASAEPAEVAAAEAAVTAPPAIVADEPEAPQPEPVAMPVKEPEPAAPGAAEGSDDDISLESILEDLRRREGRTD